MIKNSKLWKPEVNDEIGGILINKRRGVGKYNNNLYQIKDGRVIYNVWGKTQLDSIMEAATIGDLVSLRYLGVEKVNDHEMKKFELEILNE